MKRLAIIALVLLPLACATPQPGAITNKLTPGRGAITLTVTPNPVVATSLGGGVYDFPFDVVVKETGGHPVTIDKVTANVFTAGGIPVTTESYDAARIQSLGFAIAIPSKGELHYHFDPRKTVADDKLFSSVYGDIRVEGLDDNGTRTSSMVTITLTKK